MLAASKRLNSRFLAMKHVTYLAHALHRVSEQVRLENPDVYVLISNVKKVFLKAPNKVNFQFKNPDLPLPPQLVIIRLGHLVKGSIILRQTFHSNKGHAFPFQ
ncbi:unnamed protein product [Arctia plantaginis]|uniref:Uncharacterized protein n=1 Tax=Arctia plantaginis TaxID=874455 RepID=A0A8S0ZY66_ARCPL|nr:unnamed protein product [Arctia plantaginis]